MRAEYVKEYHHGMYLELLMDGKWNEYLHNIDEKCHQRINTLVKQIKASVGITEELKRTDQMKWVGLMNNVRNAVEEMVMEEVVYF